MTGKPRPDEQQDDEQDPVTKRTPEEIQQHAATVIQILRLMDTVPLDVLEATLKLARDVKSRDDALGCLVSPEGYFARSDMHEAKIARCQALVDLRKAGAMVDVAHIKSQHEAQNRGMLNRVLGIGG